MIIVAATRQWLQPNLSGVELVARGSHSATLVKKDLIIYGGSTFNRVTEEMVQHNDVIKISTGECIQSYFESISIQLLIPNSIKPLFI